MAVNCFVIWAKNCILNKLLDYQSNKCFKDSWCFHCRRRKRFHFCFESIQSYTRANRRVARVSSSLSTSIRPRREVVYWYYFCRRRDAHLVVVMVVTLRETFYSCWYSSLKANAWCKLVRRKNRATRSSNLYTTNHNSLFLSAKRLYYAHTSSKVYLPRNSSRIVLNPRFGFSAFLGP